MFDIYRVYSVPAETRNVQFFKTSNKRVAAKTDNLYMYASQISKYLIPAVADYRLFSHRQHDDCILTFTYAHQWYM